MASPPNGFVRCHLTDRPFMLTLGPRQRLPALPLLPTGLLDLHRCCRSLLRLSESFCGGFRPTPSRPRPVIRGNFPRSDNANRINPGLLTLSNLLASRLIFIANLVKAVVAAGRRTLDYPACEQEWTCCQARD